MHKPSIALALIVASQTALAAAPAFAVTPVNNLNQRPVGAIAADLGVAPHQFIDCFVDVRPAAPGTTPTRTREQSNKAILLPCLQAANSAITNDLLDEVMNRYRGIQVDQPL